MADGRAIIGVDAGSPHIGDLVWRVVVPLVTVVDIETSAGEDRSMPAVERNTISSNRLELLEAAHARTHDDLTQLRQRVDDHHADVSERFDQLQSDLQRAIGVNDRRSRAFAESQQQILDHLALLTGNVAVLTDNVAALTVKVVEHDARFEQIDARFDTLGSKLDDVLRRLA